MWTASINWQRGKKGLKKLFGAAAVALGGQKKKMNVERRGLDEMSQNLKSRRT